VEAFSADGVVFADGTAEPFDVVVAATGFTTGLAKILAPADVLDPRGLPLTAADGASARAGLYFVGYRESPRGSLYEIRHDAPLLAAAVSRFLEESA
jgi:putative flavoprotein involved in K+ transport